jgi:hypothetical protein
MLRRRARGAWTVMMGIDEVGAVAAQAVAVLGLRAIIPRVGGGGKEGGRQAAKGPR